MSTALRLPPDAPQASKPIANPPSLPQPHHRGTHLAALAGGLITDPAPSAFATSRNPPCHARSSEREAQAGPACVNY